MRASARGGYVEGWGGVTCLLVCAYCVCSSVCETEAVTFSLLFSFLFPLNPLKHEGRRRDVYRGSPLVDATGERTHARVPSTAAGFPYPPSPPPLHFHSPPLFVFSFHQFHLKPEPGVPTLKKIEYTFIQRLTTFASIPPSQKLLTVASKLSPSPGSREIANL